ncbi:hypothetical protein IAT38_003460 [Cryptococcus sp. DSM 104549]
MSGKPSYAAVAAASPTKQTDEQQPEESQTTAADNEGHAAGPSDAPPPYTNIPPKIPPPMPCNMPVNPAYRQAPHAQGQHFHNQHYRSAEHHGLPPLGAEGWVQPPPDVAKARAQRRFWGAFFWAWVIWLLLGMMIGGGVSDVENNPPGRHGHWDKHGEWHDDKGRVYRTFFQKAVGAVSGTAGGNEITVESAAGGAVAALPQFV